MNESNPNNPELTEQIFKDRWNEDVHTVDQGRFDQLTKYYIGGKYLDVGCFNSPKPGQLAENPNYDIHALDYAPRVVEVMQAKFPKVKYQVGNACKMPYPGETFDYVVAGEILEHMEYPEELISDCMRVLKSEGFLAISTPFEEGITGPPVSYEHLWGFTAIDLKSLLSPWGEVEITTNEDNLKVFITYCKKF